MNINTNLFIALKRTNNKYVIFKINLFTLEGSNIFEDKLVIEKSSNKEIVFKIQCHFCGKQHVYRYDIVEIFKKNIFMLGCKELGFPIIILGTEIEVKNKVSHYNFINSKIEAMF